MPNWNLRDDWPSRFLPKGITRDKLFSLPVLVPNAAQYKLTIEEDAKQLEVEFIDKKSCNKKTKKMKIWFKVKKLVIDIQSNILTDISVYAMTPGILTSNGKKTTLTSDIFSVEGVNRWISSKTPKSTFPVRWFKNWVNYGKIPYKIIYDNIKNGKTGPIKAGQPIGTADLEGIAFKRVKISIEYKNGIPMHPREFFSLLFWDKNLDPILKKTKPDEYNKTNKANALLHKMMTTFEDPKGSSTADPYSNNAYDIINRSKDDWLGLRPPLRTYKRIEWEHIKEHLRTDFSSWKFPNSVASRLTNPYIYKFNGYKKWNKCNLYAGEMLFRSGFRTTASAYDRLGCDKTGQLPCWLKYKGPKGLYNAPKTAKRAIRSGGSINRDGKITGACKGTTPTHLVCHFFARNHTLPTTNNAMNSINYRIHNYGEVFLGISKKHVTILAKAHKYDTSKQQLTIFAIDHWDKADPKDKPFSLWEKCVRIFKIRPGGDPTEYWGQIESNCLKRVW